MIRTCGPWQILPPQIRLLLQRPDTKGRLAPSAIPGSVIGKEGAPCDGFKRRQRVPHETGRQTLPLSDGPGSTVLSDADNTFVRTEGWWRIEARPRRSKDDRGAAAVEVVDEHICIREEDAQEEMFELLERLQCLAERALQTRTTPNAG